VSDNGKENTETMRQLEELVEQWVESLPTEFILGTVGNGSSGVQHRYPDLHFKADAHTPGLYYADLEPGELSQNGNGHQHQPSIETKDDTIEPPTLEGP
jgi:hypothetical protein